MGIKERGMESFAAVLEGFAESSLPRHDGSEKSMPSQIKLPDYPLALIEKAFDNAVAHPLLTMSHIDRHGNAFCSVMGFTYIDGKVNIVARPNAAKIKQLQSIPASR